MTEPALVLSPPAPGATPAAPVPLPTETVAPQQVAQGKLLFGRYCQVCHGANAAGGGVLPNLQNSPVLADAETWKSILIDGALKDQGMVSFAKVMTPEQAQAVRHYIIDEARWARANLGNANAAGKPAAAATPAETASMKTGAR